MSQHNFMQWNPQQSNQESDTQYAAETLRANGATLGPSVFPSSVANKLYYQLTTFVKSFCDAMGAKGYSLSDQASATLAAQFLNVMTQADMAPYALLQSPAFKGLPTAPTPSTGTRTTQVATAAQFSTEFPFSITANASWQKLASGVIVQWGGAVLPSGNGDTITMPTTFPSSFNTIVAMDAGGALYNVSGGAISLSTARLFALNSATGNFTSATIRYVAFGN